MKNVLILLCVIVVMVSCKKTKPITPTPTATPTPQILEKVVSKITTPTSNFTETTEYSNSLDTILVKTTYTNTATIYTTKYLKINSQLLTGWSYSNTALSTTFNYWLNPNGSVDTFSSIRPNNTINSTGKYTYYNDGMLKTDLSNYISYKNLYTLNTENGNAKYRIYDFNRVSPLTVTKDSTVYTYLPNKENVVSHTHEQLRIFGKPNKNLISSAITYSLPSNNIISETNYTYTFNDKGNISTRLWVITDRINNVETRRDFTTYTYKQ